MRLCHWSVYRTRETNGAAGCRMCARLARHLHQDNSVKLWELVIDGETKHIEAVNIELRLICTEL